MIKLLRRCLRKLRGTEEIIGEGLISMSLSGLGCDIALNHLAGRLRFCLAYLELNN
jgi:hypothetical protein